MDADSSISSFSLSLSLKREANLANLAFTLAGSRIAAESRAATRDKS